MWFTSSLVAHLGSSTGGMSVGRGGRHFGRQTWSVTLPRFQSTTTELPAGIAGMAADKGTCLLCRVAGENVQHCNPSVTSSARRLHDANAAVDKGMLVVGWELVLNVKRRG